ncbi:hypothetical protein [Chryseobacterium sp.]|uniref:hypothetical protein n=1 Tax=Chryseobacterium sp. TaxID=1871047 RepID=UPI0024E205DA|nr:hypothetical protein [Chryseobacterium sp.]
MTNLQTFLSESVLYQKQIIFENYSADNNDYSTPDRFNEKTFEYYCCHEDKNTTFKLDVGEVGRYSYSRIPEEYFNGEHLDFTFNAIGKCQSCNKFSVYFLLNVTSDKPISDIISMHEVNLFTDRSNIDVDGANIIIQKAGVFPEVSVKINKQVLKFFSREMSTFYYKGVKCINDNYGVGALAYFRRIIENELLKIIEEIRDLPDSDKTMIQKLLDEHSANPSVSTIYTHIIEYMPNSLKILGHNPIKLLYNQTSEGLHSYTENESKERAQEIRMLLEFVIIRINEEKSIVKDIKEIIKNLKS